MLMGGEGKPAVWPCTPHREDMEDPRATGQQEVAMARGKLTEAEAVRKTDSGPWKAPSRPSGDENSAVATAASRAICCPTSGSVFLFSLSLSQLNPAGTLPNFSP